MEVFARTHICSTQTVTCQSKSIIGVTYVNGLPRAASANIAIIPIRVVRTYSDLVALSGQVISLLKSDKLF